MPKPHKRIPIYLFSDSSGNLLEHMMGAFLTQFPDHAFSVNICPFINDMDRLKEEMVDLEPPGLILHAFVEKKLKMAVEKLSAKKNIPSWDVTGPTMQFIAHKSGISPFKKPQPIHRLDSNYHGRMKTFEFAMQHDDSRRIEDLEKADIILVGISRVSKSPTSLFLAYRGFNVSNVSIVPSQGIPEMLKKHRKKNIVSLTIQPKKLADIRGRRFADWKIEDFPYDHLREVVDEVVYAEKLYREMGWPMIDSTDLAIEETSTLILQKLKLKPKLFIEEA